MHVPVELKLIESDARTKQSYMICESVFDQIGAKDNAIRYNHRDHSDDGNITKHGVVLLTLNLIRHLREFDQRR